MFAVNEACRRFQLAAAHIQLSKRHSHSDRKQRPHHRLMRALRSQLVTAAVATTTACVAAAVRKLWQAELRQAEAALLLAAARSWLAAGDWTARCSTARRTTWCSTARRTTRSSTGCTGWTTGRSTRSGTAGSLRSTSWCTGRSSTARSCRGTSRSTRSSTGSALRAASWCTWSRTARRLWSTTGRTVTEQASRSSADSCSHDHERSRQGRQSHNGHLLVT
jgi:hypothetical protein